MTDYTIKLPQAHLLALIQMLEQVPAPLAQTYPIWAGLKRQLAAQDEANAITVQSVQSPA